MGIGRSRRSMSDALVTSQRLSAAMHRLAMRGVPVQAIADTYNLSRQAVSARLTKYRKEVLKEGRPIGPPAAGDRALIWRQHLDHPDLHCKAFIASFQRRLVHALKSKLTACHLTQADVCARVDPREGGRGLSAWLSRFLAGRLDARIGSIARLAWAMGMDLEIKLSPTRDKRAVPSPPSVGESVPAPLAPHLFGPVVAAPDGVAPFPGQTFTVKSPSDTAEVNRILRELANDKPARQNGR